MGTEIKLPMQEQAEKPDEKAMQKFLETIWNNVDEAVREAYLTELSNYEKRLAKKYAMSPEQIRKLDPVAKSHYINNLKVAQAKLDKFKLKLYNKHLQPQEVIVLAKLRNKAK